ncbi:MAG: sensor histidine kinase [Bdellovibrionia bacterium]
MKRKYFIFTFLVLLFSTGSSIAILLTYFRAERLALIDEQIRIAATSLVKSKLGQMDKISLQEAEEIMTEELGPKRVGKFFIVRDSSNKIIFQTQNIALLNIELDKSQQWVSKSVNTYFVRVLNLNLPNIPDRTLQVGVILEDGLLNLTGMSLKRVLVIIAILVLTTALTFYLAAKLFKPIKNLTLYLSTITKQLDSGNELTKVADLNWYKHIQNADDNEDFKALVNSINNLVEKVNSSRRFMRTWSFQMAHELKTPISILNQNLDNIRGGTIEDSTVNDLREMALKVSQIVSAFLNWAELNSRKEPGELFAIDAGATAKRCVDELKNLHDGRVEVIINEEFTIICNPFHFEQLITNLVQNSIKYSTGKIEVIIENHILIIKDNGSGIPLEVLSNLGTPFNRGRNHATKKQGFGLGLAWVKTICDLYRWSFQASSPKEAPAQVRIHFE